LGFLNSVLAPTLAANLMSPAANFSESAARESLLQAKISSQVSFTDGNMYRASMGLWTWNGIELHSSPFKVAYSFSNPEKLIWYAGKIPEREALENQLSVPGTGHNLHPSQAQSLFADHLQVGTWVLSLPTPIIRLNVQGPEAWWRLNAGSAGRVFWLRENDGLIGEEPPVRMQAEATALLFRENKVASAATGIEEIKLTDLLDVSYLRNRIFRILNCAGKKKSFLTCGNFARSGSGRYEFSYESFEFPEMVGYYSIQRAAQWHRGIQSDAQKQYFLNFNLNGPIDVFVMSDDSNGPAYSPRSNSLNTNNPVITVPDKYGNLSNLARDSDVFFHEFTHHVLYRSVKPKTGSSQARSIQEGLADYFTYAMTGNNTLAESVQDGEPLRSATVETNISEETFAPNFDPYPAGVLLSSVLWKLRSELGDWRDGYKIIDKVVWDSIDLMPELGTFYQLACAIVKTADGFEKTQNLTNGQVKTPIISAFATRGFFENTTLNEQTGCPAVSALLKVADDNESQVSELPLDVKPPAPVTFTGEARVALPPYGGSRYQPLQPKRAGCGDLAATRDLNRSLWGAVFILLIPLLLRGLRTRKSN